MLKIEIFYLLRPSCHFKLFHWIIFHSREAFLPQKYIHRTLIGERFDLKVKKDWKLLNYNLNVYHYDDKNTD